MYLLAGEISNGNAITIIVLCVLTVVLLLVNAVIVIMLHKMNKKLAKQKESIAIEEQVEKDEIINKILEENRN